MPITPPRAFAFAVLSSFTFAQQTVPVVPTNADAARTILAALPVQEAVADGVEVRVLDGLTQQPVAGADVFAITEQQDEALARQVQALAADPTATVLLLAAVQSTRYRTDSDGRVRVPRAARHGLLVIAGDRLGIGRVEQKVPIEVYAEHSVDVVVRTADGKPVRGARIGVGRTTASQPGHTKHVTDRDGRAHVAVDRLMGLDVHVGVLGAFGTPCEQKVDLRKPRGEPVGLVVPPCGQVRFILYGPDEKPATGLGFVHLRLVGDAGPGARIGRGTTAWPSDQAGDNVVFACVEIGHDVVVTAEVAGMSKTVEFRGKGPTRAGELVVVEGRLAAGPPILAFRVVDAQGQAIANERVGLVVRREGGYRMSDTTTDAEGRIVLPLQDAADKALWVLRRRVAPATEYRGAAHRAFDALAPGRQDLGDLQCVDEPIAARGRLVDGAGKPIAGAFLRGGTTITTGGGGGSSTAGFWFFEHRVQTAADGTFAVRELAALDVPLRLAIEGSDWVAPEGITLRTGQADVQEFKLLPPSRIPARFPGDDLQGLRVDASLVHRETRREIRTQFHDGVLIPTSIAAGTYDLTIGPDLLAFRIEGIEAPPSGAATDARLQPLVLPTGLLLVRATAVDEAGQPVPGVDVWCRFQQGNRRHGVAQRTDANGRVVLLARSTQCEIGIQDKGWEAVTTETITPEMQLRVARVAPLDVQFVGLPARPAGFDVHVSCTRDPAQRAFGTLLQGDRTTLQFTARGTWHLRLLPRFDADTTLPNTVRQQINRDLASLDLRFEVEAKGAASAPVTLTLSKEQQDDFAEVLRSVQALRDEHKGK